MNLDIIKRHPRQPEHLISFCFWPETIPDAHSHTHTQCSPIAQVLSTAISSLLTGDEINSCEILSHLIQISHTEDRRGALQRQHRFAEKRQWGWKVSVRYLVKSLAHARSHSSCSKVPSALFNWVLKFPGTEIPYNTHIINKAERKKGGPFSKSS